MTTPQVLFRCDASPEIGAGHATRCLALAEALVETGWRAVFAVARGTLATVPALGEKEFSVIELSGDTADEPALLREAVRGEIDLLVADHYQRDIAFERACRGFAQRIWVLDDATGRHHDCDVLIDAAATDPSTYAECVPANARLLLGSSYALVRRAFVERRAEALPRRDRRPVETILVSFGATDPRNVTAVALDALARLADRFSIVIALSSQASHLEAVKKKLHGKIRLVLDADMPALMTEADIAVGAAGASAYERAVLGLPTVIVTLADNQRGIAEGMNNAGAAIDAGPFDAMLPERLGRAVQKLLADHAARMDMSEAAASLLDGRGAQRLLVAAAGTIATASGYDVRLRFAGMGDENWLLELQRVPQTRRYFRNPHAPSAVAHARWMVQTLADRSALFLVIEATGERAGYIRLDRRAGKHSVYEVSVAIHPQFHGRGIASAALALARRVQPAAVFDAEILPENDASKVLFMRAGFQRVDDGLYRQWPLN